MTTLLICTGYVLIMFVPTAWNGLKMLYGVGTTTDLVGHFMGAMVGVAILTAGLLWPS